MRSNPLCLVSVVLVLTTACPHPGAAPDAGCVIDTHGGPVIQSTARIGAYYFDGWSGGLNDYHLSQLIPGTDGTEREPLSGWEDKTACEVEQQLAWASSYGLSFFMFDWYYPPNLSQCSGACWYLNNALNTYLTLSDRHGMGFAVVYVNQDSFTVSPSQWADAVQRWAALFADPDYVHVNGKALFMVIDMYGMQQTFGMSAPSVKSALDQVRAAAQSKGLPGAFIVGGYGVATGGAFNSAQFDQQLAQYAGDGYDAYGMYTYGPGLDGGAGVQSFSLLSDTAQWVWAETLKQTSVPIIPTATIGWDCRPETFNEGGLFEPLWVVPSPEDASGLVRSAANWAEQNPGVRPVPSPEPPLVMIDAWNELLEGSYLVPTVGRAHATGDALANDMAQGSARHRTMLTLNATALDAGAPYLVTGTLFTEDGGALGGDVAMTATPTTGPGPISVYSTSGVVPTGAVTAQLNMGANLGASPPGAATVGLFRVDFQLAGDSSSRVPNGNLSSGSSGWSFVGPASFVSLPDGGGEILLQADAGERAWAGSANFPVTEDAGFTADFVSQSAPASAGYGNWLVAFFYSDAGYAGGAAIPFATASLDAGPVATAGGRFSLDITNLGTSGLDLTASYRGDATDWPAVARTQRPR